MKSILVVDDENRIREQYARALSVQGYDVLTAADAPTANALLKERSIHLVLLDINMPEVDGTTLSELIYAFHPEIKVIVSSVYPLEEQRQRVRFAHDYFDKSEGLLGLLNKVQEHVGRGSEGNRAPGSAAPYSPNLDERAVGGTGLNDDAGICPMMSIAPYSFMLGSFNLLL